MSRRHDRQNPPFPPDVIKSVAQRAWKWIAGPGRLLLMQYGGAFAHQVRRNLTTRRLLSVPHLLVAIWMVILLWGERWVFDSKVSDCHWENWEKWPKGANPHHLVFVADPQLIDPHSYPGRPWPLNPLTILVTDNYLRRGYRALQSQLHPDSLFFLGDLFDGGREWKTRQGKFVDPKWGRQRSKDEKKLVKTWHRKYGEDFWLDEYDRFGDIFFDGFKEGGDKAGKGQRGRKLVASLPGNHDLGFGAQVQVPVRDRFTTYFGDVNRVDVVGNHSIVSVDAVSLSADTSTYMEQKDLLPIYGPVNEFLANVKSTKRKAVQEELSFWHGTDRGVRFDHSVSELDQADLSKFPKFDPGEDGPEFPTILLTHVPLFRPQGTPCGPKREHWPPTKPKKGEKGPVFPDDRNAISVTAGYQYQNVLSEQDSVKLIKSVGNVVHVFSGDDHDYCELTHSPAKGNVREITVKSMSMAMGVSHPGFVMASLYNPVDEKGKPIPGAPEGTLQTHLCILPNQLAMYMKYVMFLILSIVILTVRAFLVPVLSLTPFALEPEQHSASSGQGSLPMYKDKVEPPEANYGGRTSSSGTSSYHLPSRLSATATTTGGRSKSPSSAGRWQAKRSRNAKRWGWGAHDGPRIHVDDDFYDTGKKTRKVGGRQALGVVGRELWTSTWRVVWMAVFFWAYLARQG